MKNIFDALNAIKIKPELYIGAKNLTYLYHFINGYNFKSLTTEDATSKDYIQELHFWLPEKTGVEIEDWLQNLLLKADFDEEKALLLFFDYLEIFKIEKGFVSQ
jgi:hypothetical protein